jgi:PiT family inorganic phosphate transporter
MVVAWVITLPAAGVVGALCWALAHGLGASVGTAVVLALLIAAAGFMFWRSRRTAINAHNVNAEWEGGLAPAEPTASVDAAAGTPARVA